MMIDAHQHFWRLSRGDYAWLTPALQPIYRDFEPSDLAPLLTRHAIEKTILVQAAPTVEETEFLLTVAAETAFVAGVVGWVNFTAPEAPATIDRLARNGLFVGLRPMVQDIADDDWLLERALAPAFDAVERNGLVFDALVLPHHLTRLLVLAERRPGLAIVIDHGAKPFIRQGRLDPWSADMAALAAHPNVVCKLSGLATEAAPVWSTDDLRPFVDHLLDVFGPRRLLWGSDWPVVELAGGYDAWRRATEELLAPLHEAERTAAFGGNARRIYLAGRGRSGAC